jgi:hypothetical protein
MVRRAIAMVRAVYLLRRIWSPIPLEPSQSVGAAGAALTWSRSYSRYNINEATFSEGDDETNSSLHTNMPHVTVRSSASMWDTARSVAV